MPVFLYLFFDILSPNFYNSSVFATIYDIFLYSDIYRL